MVDTQTRIFRRKWNPKTCLGFWDTNVSPNSAQTKCQENKTCHLEEFIASTGQKEKIKESKRIDKYTDLSREQKGKQTVEHASNGDIKSSWCLWNSRQKLGKKTGRTEVWRTNRDPLEYWDKSWRTERTFCRSGSSEKLPGKAGLK